jgi:7-cyano-7-deazaguanine synthase
MKTLVLLSGGMDSTALASKLVKENGPANVESLSVHYGQRHSKELESARAVAAVLGIIHHEIDLGILRHHLTGSALTDDIDVPDGHYAEQTMRATVVPNRNAIMLSVAVGVAVSRGLEQVATAVHAGDHFIYPDCRPEFIAAMDRAARTGTESFGDIRIVAPFVNVTKADIATIGASVGAPFPLSWSCYKGGEIHCGACGTCYERREAFTVAGVPDPTVYAATPEFADPTVGA